MRRSHLCEHRRDGTCGEYKQASRAHSCAVYHSRDSLNGPRAGRISMRCALCTGERRQVQASGRRRFDPGLPLHLQYLLRSGYFSGAAQFHKPARAARVTWILEPRNCLTPGTPSTTYGETETRFTNATLSAAELARITALCGFIQTDCSGFGICRSCRLGGLGDVQQ